MSKLTDLARGQNCMIRLPGICSFDQSTVVLCHYRLAGECGTGIKPPDLLGAWGCDRCHSAVDGRLETEFTREYLRLAHAEACLRTIAELIRLGLV